MTLQDARAVTTFLRKLSMRTGIVVMVSMQHEPLCEDCLRPVPPPEGSRWVLDGLIDKRVYCATCTERMRRS